MSVIKLPFISSALFLAISACGNTGPVDSQANRTSGIPDVSQPAPPAIGELQGATSAAKAAPAPIAKIPAAFQGRWGLAPRDCSASPVRATTLLVITPEDLHFNQAAAVETSDVETNPQSINGTFAFSGGGRSWTKFEALTLDNHRLIRTESDPAASFSYAKCS